MLLKLHPKEILNKAPSSFHLLCQHVVHTKCERQGDWRGGTQLNLKLYLSLTHSSRVWSDKKKFPHFCLHLSFPISASYIQDCYTINFVLLTYY